MTSSKNQPPLALSLHNYPKSPKFFKMNFGVLEIAPTKKFIATPGWAYVPDVKGGPTTALQPRRRGVREPVSSLEETTAKQDVKIMREIAALERDNHKDVSIPVPARHRDNAGRVSQGKATPAVRKILQSQKTFANHIDDFEAFSQQNSAATSQQHSTQAGGRNAASSVPAVPAPQTGTGKRAYRRKSNKQSNLRESITAIPDSAVVKAEADSRDVDVAMTDASNTILLLDSDIPPPHSHPGDRDPLLISRIPALPSQAELQALLAAPPLTYAEARGPWVAEDKRKPVRRFCEICGYWGRIKCSRCGGRICALECLEVHKEDCFTRFGA